MTLNEGETYSFCRPKCAFQYHKEFQFYEHNSETKTCICSKLIDDRFADVDKVRDNSYTFGYLDSCGKQFIPFAVD